MNKKTEHWIKPRNIFVNAIVRIFLIISMKVFHGFRYERIKDKNRSYLFLGNHQTVWDQFLLGLMATNKTIFIASEDLFSHKFISNVLKFLVNPIPYKKSSVDFSLFRSCKKVVNDNGSIALFPEGNRTYSGKTEYIKFTIVKLVRFLKIPVVLTAIEGGYGKFPRWSSSPRRGKFYGKIRRIIEPAEYEKMTDQQLYNAIRSSIYVDETNVNKKYYSKRLAEGLERVIYECPTCGYTHFETYSDILKCKTCNLTLRYTDEAKFIGVNCTAPFKNVNEWYEYQQNNLYNLDLDKLDQEKPLFIDTIDFFEIIPRKKSLLLAKDATLKMYPNKITITYDDKTDTYMFNEISSAGCFGKNKLNFFIGYHTYQFRNKHLNSLKYVQTYFRSKMKKGDNDNDKFFGL